jgi:hypothetical protein
MQKLSERRAGKRVVFVTLRKQALVPKETCVLTLTISAKNLVLFTTSVVSASEELSVASVTPPSRLNDYKNLRRI